MFPYPFPSPLLHTPFYSPLTNLLNSTAQVLTALEEALQRGDIPEASLADGKDEEVLRGFLSEYGRKFYGIAPATRRIRVTRGGATVEESLKGEGVEIVPFRAGEGTWGVEWL